MKCANIRDIQRAVADEFGLTMPELLSDRSARRFAEPRQVAMWLVSKTTRLSLPAIGRGFYRDHTTVMHGVARVEDKLGRDVAFRCRVVALLWRFENCVDYGDELARPAARPSLRLVG